MWEGSQHVFGAPQDLFPPHLKSHRVRSALMALLRIKAALLVSIALLASTQTITTRRGFTRSVSIALRVVINPVMALRHAWRVKRARTHWMAPRNVTHVLLARTVRLRVLVSSRICISVTRIELQCVSSRRI